MSIHRHRGSIRLVDQDRASPSSVAHAERSEQLCIMHVNVRSLLPHHTCCDAMLCDPVPSPLRTFMMGDHRPISRITSSGFVFELIPCLELDAPGLVL
jgi:hypothetical protein